ncbi:hypothetical protein CLV98_101575 [Dyadobacter jejuensis]|uniref:Uncharacterized protein n=1 Tax=Dyadobacter jejuensis TaxID=1082580 RepID=A0A316ASH7_9BACT|nr:hypothetical protein CLV98_101575 [Dyadobacter jejuensis]
MIDIGIDRIILAEGDSDEVQEFMLLLRLGVFRPKDRYV